MATPQGGATPHGGETIFPPFNAETFPSQIFWFVIFFGALYLLMSRVALPRLAGIIEGRKARIEGDLAEANSAQDKATEAAKAYEATLAEARNSAQETARQMRDKISAESNAKRAELESRLNTELAAAEARIAKMKADAMGNVATIAEDSASLIVQQLTGKAADPGAIKSAIAALKT